MSVLDTTFLILFTLLFPLYGVVSYRALLREIDRGTEDVRVRAYQKTITVQWLMAGFLLAIWTGQGRTLDDLGFSWEAGWQLWVAAAVGLLIILGFEVQRQAVIRGEKLRREVRESARSLAALLPHTTRDFNWFALVSVTAGVCEELLYRSYLIWYLLQFGGPTFAVFGSAVLFGYGHAYQGLSGFAKTAAVGLVAGGLYLLGGTILIPIAVHIAIDLIQGHMLYQVFQE